MANLVIVESPSKVSTIKGYLGSNYKVVASKGHVRDLPKSSLGVDIEHDFAAHYINIRGKGPLINELKKEAKNASKVFLAADADPMLTAPVAEHCRAQQIEVVSVPTMHQLGAACGIPVKAAVAAIV